MFVSTVQAQTPRFRIIDLTSFDGFDPIVGTYGSMGINNYGEVVYTKQVSSVLHPWVWLPAENANYITLSVGFNDLFDIEEETGIARDISDSGIIVGQTGGGQYFSVTGDEACAWDLRSSPPEGFFNLLGTLGASSADYSGADAINNDDPPFIVGMSALDGNCLFSCTGIRDDATAYSAFKVEFDGPFTLAPLDTALYNSSHATGVSTTALTTNLQIAGASTCNWYQGCSPPGFVTCDNYRQPTYWESQSGVPMPALPAIDPDDAGSFARGMSDNGRVVGWGHDFTAGFPPQCTRHPLYWENIEAAAFDLGDFMPDGQEGNAAWAEDVNNTEYPAVVGWNDETETKQRFSGNKRTKTIGL